MVGCVFSNFHRITKTAPTLTKDSDQHEHPAHSAPTAAAASTSDLGELREALVRFREERRWGVYHNPKDLAVALSVEAGELLEVFLWKSGEEADLERVKEELADVLAYALLLADRCNLDVRQIVLDKIAQNALKYPVDKAAGNARKYTDL